VPGADLVPQIGELALGLALVENEDHVQSGQDANRLQGELLGVAGADADDVDRAPSVRDVPHEQPFVPASTSVRRLWRSAPQVQAGRAIRFQHEPARGPS
jgi:hypothetical protein